MAIHHGGGRQRRLQPPEAAPEAAHQGGEGPGKDERLAVADRGHLAGVQAEGQVAFHDQLAHPPPAAGNGGHHSDDGQARQRRSLPGDARDGGGEEVHPDDPRDEHHAQTAGEQGGAESHAGEDRGARRIVARHHPSPQQEQDARERHQQSVAVEGRAHVGELGHGQHQHRRRQRRSGRTAQPTSGGPGQEGDAGHDGDVDQPEQRHHPIEGPRPTGQHRCDGEDCGTDGMHERGLAGDPVDGLGGPLRSDVGEGGPLGRRHGIDGGGRG